MEGEAAVRAPLIIVGTGRCGSTLLQGLLAAHPGLEWLSGVASRSRGWGLPNRVVTSIGDLPGCAYLRRSVPPSEAYPLWERCFAGFRRPCRDLGEDDAYPWIKDAIRSGISRQLRGKGRPLVKLTGWPRLGFLRAVFPDAQFIHVVRDGRAVANSLLGTTWWEGWRGPENWRWGPLSEGQRSRWEESGRSFLVLAGLQWEILMDAAEAGAQMLDAGAYMCVRYEDLCQEPGEELERVFRFCSLGSSQRVNKEAARLVRPVAGGALQDVPHSEERAFEKALSAALGKHGYGIAD